MTLARYGSELQYLDYNSVCGILDTESGVMAFSKIGIPYVSVAFSMMQTYSITLLILVCVQFPRRLWTTV
jgi:hypothetical protein